MLQEIARFHLFGHVFPIYGYGFMLVVAFFTCIVVAQWLARGAGINPDLIVNAALIALITGMIGARLCHILENFHEYTRLSLGEDLRNMVNLREGGLTFYGGFLLATPCCIFYAWRHRIPILRGMDIVAPVLMIGLGLGRVGCFLNGCCYGQQCDLPWAVRFPYASYAYLDQFGRGQIAPPPPLVRYDITGGVGLLSPDSPQMQGSPVLRQLAEESRALPVHPAELYSAFTAFLLAALLIAAFTLPHHDGRIFALMLMLEGIGRFLLEMLRVEPTVWSIHAFGHIYGWSISMIIGWLCIPAGMVMWWAVGMGRRPQENVLAASNRKAGVRGTG